MSEKQSLRKQQDTEKKPQASYDQAIKREEVQQIMAQVVSQYSGPIPPAEVMRGYEEILPGAADRILTMAEKQSAHRQEIEKTIVKVESRDSLLGIWLAFALGVGCLIVGTIIVWRVPATSGAITGSLVGVTGIGSIIATMIKSTRMSSENKKE